MDTKYPNCEERIEKELEHELAKMRLVLELEEATNEHDIDPELWRYEIIEKRRQGLLDQEEARELWDLFWEGEGMGYMSLRDYEEGLLSIDNLYTVYRVQMSWGGPSDEFEVFVDEDKEIVRIDYVFKDWFDGARRNLMGDDYSLAKELLGLILMLGV